jgi:hypothetical protein
MQLRQNFFPYAMAMGGAGALIASSYITASSWAHGLLLSFLCGCLFTTMVVLGITKVKASEIKFERQLREIEMEAHKYNISAMEIDTYVEDTSKFKNTKRIQASESRAEKLSFILEQLGFSATHKLLRTLRENRSVKK